MLASITPETAKPGDEVTLTVTIEPDDGDAASSGNRVLVVPLLPPSS